MNQPAGLVIYPNPSRDLINIVVPKENETDELTISIYNMIGVKVEETTLPGLEKTVVFNIESRQSGLYMVSVSNKGKIVARGKFIKQ